MLNEGHLLQLLLTGTWCPLCLLQKYLNDFSLFYSALGAIIEWNEVLDRSGTRFSTFSAIALETPHRMQAFSYSQPTFSEHQHVQFIFVHTFWALCIIVYH